MSAYALEGVVLGRSPWREGGLAVSLYARGRGKVRLIARGARLQRGKLKGLIEPGLWVWADAQTGRRWDTLTSSVTREAFLGWRRSVAGVAAAGMILEMTDKLTPEGAGGEKVFVVLTGALQNLERHCVSGQTASLPRDILWFQMNFLNLLGLKPETQRCVRCGKKLGRDQDKIFSLARGGAVHRLCAFAARDSEGWAVSDEILQLMHCVLADKTARDLAAEVSASLIKWESEKVRAEVVWRTIALLEKFMIFNAGVNLRAGAVSRSLLHTVG